MKQPELLKLIEQLKNKPSLLRKLKIFAIIGAAGLIVTSALLIWAGVAAYTYVADKAGAVTTIEQVDKFGSQIQAGLLGLDPMTCWEKAQTLMAVEPWLQKPAIENLNNLKLACVQP